MNADQSIAEWIPDDPTLESEPDVESPAPGPSPASPARRARRSKALPHDAGPQPRSVALQRPRRIPAALGLGGPETRFVELADELGRRIRREPLKALAVAAGVGFLVGGAMTFRAGRLLLAAGARQAARALLKQLL
jgi:hypothetical protein